MNESDTRLLKIDPKLKTAGWGVTDGSRITTEYCITKGKVSQSQKTQPKRADYVLVYKGVKVAIVEAKSDELSYAEGVGQYSRDFFDMVVVDECHRGGAKDESNWRGILEYFEPAVQLGLTTTPRIDQNVNTYAYFTYHAYEYSLRQGIDDGFLTPFRHINMKSNIDDYIYSPDDEVLSGVVEEPMGRPRHQGDFDEEARGCRLWRGHSERHTQDNRRRKERLDGCAGIYSICHIANRT